MTSVQLKDLKGKAVGEVSFEDSIFGQEPNIHVMHAALHRQLCNARSGSANTKTRAEVRGGGRKPWRQKGTGRARAGSIRSPLWNGGGVIFGPKPRDFSHSLNKKVRQLALRSALAARKDEFVVVQNFDALFDKAPKSGDDPKTIEQPKTKRFWGALTDLGIGNLCVLVLVDCGIPGLQQIERAARNLPGVKVLNINNLNVKDLMEAQAVLTTQRTVEAINLRFQKVTSDKAPRPPRAKGTASSASEKSAPKVKAVKVKTPKVKAPKDKTAKDKSNKVKTTETKTTKTKAEPKAGKKPAAKVPAKKSKK